MILDLARLRAAPLISDPFEFVIVGELLEGGAAALPGERKAAVMAERRKIGDHAGQMLGPHEIFDDHKIERVALQRTGPQLFEIE